ncbi:MAG: hypothetical protein JXR80_10440 [Deltaproteobacteria bacterium]|nr:hypothetical protein [Deltaproteobacteria bacterium]
MLFTSRYGTLRLIPFLLLSMLLHAALLLLLPDLTRLFNIHINRLALLGRTEIEVTLVEPEVTPQPPVEEKTPFLPAEGRIVALIDQRFKELPALGEALQMPPAPIELPEPPASPDAATLALLPLSEPISGVRPQELLGRLGRKPAGQLSGRRLGGSLETPPASPALPVDKLLSAAARKKLLDLEPPQKDPADHDFGLSGPVARSRQVLFRPALPKISLTRDVTVALRFWVRPDGTVSRVETTRIGDLELVNVAERFLQQWRFSILPAALPQTEQWGTVSIVFRVSR